MISIGLSRDFIGTSWGLSRDFMGTFPCPSLSPPAEPWASLGPHRSLYHRSIVLSHYNTLIRRVLEHLREFSHLRITMEAELKDMNKNKRYYALHREECNALRLARYHNDPTVIAKREERERKRREKEEALQAKKEAKQVERERIRQLKMQAALATRKVPKKMEGAMDLFLGSGTDSSGVKESK